MFICRVCRSIYFFDVLEGDECPSCSIGELEEVDEIDEINYEDDDDDSEKETTGDIDQ